MYRGTPLAASIPSSNSARAAWIGVYPLDLSKPMTREFVHNQGIAVFPWEGRAYRIRKFEVDRSLIDADVSIGETELKDASSWLAFSDEEILKVLESVGLSVENLELPHKSNYPI